MTHHKPKPESPAPRAGFHRLDLLPDGFMGVNGPLFGRREADGTVKLGIWVEERYCNPAQICHGGMLMTLADMMLGFTANIAHGGNKFMPTVSMSCDFAAPAPLGAWLEARGRHLHSTRNLAFCESWIEADGKLCFRASGIMRIPSANRIGKNLNDLFDAPPV